MRNFLLCILVLALDAAFALSASKAVFISTFSETWSGVPVPAWVGIAGIVVLVVLTLVVSMVAFPSRRHKS